MSEFVPTERDKDMAREALRDDGHCRYCNNMGPDAHPAMKCKGDLEDLHAAVALAIAKARLEEREAMQVWAIDVLERLGKAVK